ncbi:MAG: PAS domain S-box protein [Planctomycetota bacterium]|jgi:PAS domain S-box-containing protein
MTSVEVLRRHLERERTARKSAEDLLEQKSLEVHHANVALEEANRELERRVRERVHELEESEQRFRTAFWSAPTGLIINRPDGRFVQVNDTFAKMLGYTQTEVATKTMADVTLPEDLPDYEARVARLLAGRMDSFDVEKQYVCKDGSARWGSTRVTTLSLRGHDGPYLISQVQDVTDRIESERKLRESEQRFRDIACSAGEYIWETDSEGRFTLATERVESILGIRAERLIGRTPMEFMPPDEVECMASWFRDVMQTARPFHAAELRTVNAAGKTVWLRISGTPVFDDASRVTGYRGTGLEITQIKEAEEERARVAEQLRDALARAQSMSEVKSRFLANMSHEIRTPMTAILGYADVLTMMADVPDEVAEFARAIHMNADHLLALLNDILDLSKIEAGQLAVEWSPCDPAAALEAVAATMRGQANEKAVSLGVEHEAALPHLVRTDPVRLKQILTNLVSNAIKFTNEGSVTLRLFAEADELRFQVIDTGIGIAAEELEHIFLPFTQGDSELHLRRAGTGLGLDISQRLAGLLGGSLHVQSEPGSGSVFELRLPIELVDAEDVSELTPGGRSGDGTNAPELVGRRVAVVDDNPDNRNIVQFILERSGASVHVATNGGAALHMILQAKELGEPFDLILMDIQMPIMDGYEATRRLRQSGVETPIVALTANAMVGDEQRCLEQGCNAYVSKPIVPETLLGEISRQLRDVESRPSAADRQSRSDAAPPNGIEQDPKFQSLREDYIESLTDTAHALREIAAADDREAARVIAHRLAGTGASYGFPEISDAARACEESIRAESREDLADLTRELVKLLESAPYH